MDDPLLVRGLERLGDLLRDRQRLVDRNRALCNSVGERRPLDQLHHERTDAVGLLQAVDLRDVRMIQRRQRLGFALEARQPLGICAKASGRTLIATWRPRFVSVARYTSPMPPTPIWAVISYGPRRVPAVRATAGGCDYRRCCGESGYVTSNADLAIHATPCRWKYTCRLFINRVAAICKRAVVNRLADGSPAANGSCPDRRERRARSPRTRHRHTRARFSSSTDAEQTRRK